MKHGLAPLPQSQGGEHAARPLGQADCAAVEGYAEERHGDVEVGRLEMEAVSCEAVTRLFSRFETHAPGWRALGYSQKSREETMSSARFDLGIMGCCSEGLVGLRSPEVSSLSTMCVYLT